MNLKQSIALRVRIARQAKKLSQEQLSEQIERSTETVSNIERAVTLPTINTLQRLSRALDVPLLEFFEAYQQPVSDKKRLALELDIRQSLKKLSLDQLHIARLQVQAFVHDHTHLKKDS